LKKGGAVMGEFLQNNWFWIAVFVFFIWMHASGMGCGGHGRHGGGDEKKKPEEGGASTDANALHNVSVSNTNEEEALKCVSLISA
jgi:hypothetical protein